MDFAGNLCRCGFYQQLFLSRAKRFFAGEDFWFPLICASLFIFPVVFRYQQALEILYYGASSAGFVFLFYEWDSEFFGLLYSFWNCFQFWHNPKIFIFDRRIAGHFCCEQTIFGGRIGNRKMGFWKNVPFESWSVFAVQFGYGNGGADDFYRDFQFKNYRIYHYFYLLCFNFCEKCCIFGRVFISDRLCHQSRKYLPFFQQSFTICQPLFWHRGFDFHQLFDFRFRLFDWKCNFTSARFFRWKTDDFWLA